MTSPSISLAVFVVHLTHSLFRPFKWRPPPVSNCLSPFISISVFFYFTRDLLRSFLNPLQPLLSFHLAAQNWVRSFLDQDVVVAKSNIETLYAFRFVHVDDKYIFCTFACIRKTTLQKINTFAMTGARLRKKDQ